MYLFIICCGIFALVSAGRQEGGGATNMPKGCKLCILLCVMNNYFQGLFNVKKNETQRVVVGDTPLETVGLTGQWFDSQIVWYVDFMEPLKQTANSDVQLCVKGYLVTHDSIVQCSVI